MSKEEQFNPLECGIGFDTDSKICTTCKYFDFCAQHMADLEYLNSDEYFFGEDYDPSDTPFDEWNDDGD